MTLTIPTTGGGTILSGNSYGRALIRRHVTLNRPSLHVTSAKKFSPRGGKSRRGGSGTTTTEEREGSPEMEFDIAGGGDRTAAQITGGEFPGYFLPELPGDKPCFWEGEKWDVLGFVVEYLWALGFAFALVACGVAVATYNDGATDFKETPAYKESIQTQEFLDDSEASTPDVFESNPTEVAPSLD